MPEASLLDAACGVADKGDWVGTNVTTEYAIIMLLAINAVRSQIRQPSSDSLQGDQRQ